jgi:hypothetical protein
VENFGTWEAKFIRAWTKPALIKAYGPVPVYALEHPAGVATDRKILIPALRERGGQTIFQVRHRSGRDPKATSAVTEFANLAGTVLAADQKVP